ncbi:MAG TPA: alpha/beta fold hydrolase [Acidobacteriaceae bacterium]|nr:alpha/beta fold hydrolase [Acidobacteriaceae bacterium]
MNNSQELVEFSAGDVPVRGYLHKPTVSGADGLILTHGAGANCTALLLVALAEKFCASGFTVFCCDLPFRQSRPSGPPPRGSAEKDQEGLRAAVDYMRRRVSGRVFLGGHSYGGRQASMLAASEAGLVEGLLLLSYPLHPPQRPGELRTAHFARLQTPALFVSGSRDGFGTVVEMEAALKLVAARTELLIVAAAGHELMTKRNRDELPQMVMEGFSSFFPVH